MWAPPHEEKWRARYWNPNKKKGKERKKERKKKGVERKNLPYEKNKHSVDSESHPKQIKSVAVSLK